MIPETPITREEMYLDEIARNGGGGGGSGLPPVETTDYGKYLRADKTTGELEWSEVESGGGFFMVTLTYTLNSSFQIASFSCDKTYNEILSALQSGTPVLAFVKNGQSYAQPYPVENVLSITPYAWVMQTKAFAVGSIYRITITQNNIVSFTADEGSGLPPVTASDNGKVLSVVNGAWSAAQVPSNCTVVEVEWLSGALAPHWDMSYADIVAKINAGGIVFAHEYGLYAPVIQDEGLVYADFIYIQDRNGAKAINSHEVVLLDDNSSGETLLGYVQLTPYT